MPRAGSWARIIINFQSQAGAGRSRRKRYDSVPKTHVTLPAGDYLRPVTFGYLARYLVTYYNVTSNNADLGNGAGGAGDCDLQPLFFVPFSIGPGDRVRLPGTPGNPFFSRKRLVVTDARATSFRTMPLKPRLPSPGLQPSVLRLHLSTRVSEIQTCERTDIHGRNAFVVPGATNQVNRRYFVRRKRDL
jgi:hypothetical protein